MLGIKDILTFILQYKIFSVLMFFINIVLGFFLIKKIKIISNKNINEAKGRRNTEDTIYKKCTFVLTRYFEDYERRNKKSTLLSKAKDKAKKVGFEGENALVLYLFIRFGISILIFIVTLVINFPSVQQAIRATGLVFVVIELNFSKKEREINRSLQRYVYKIYKYLNNQISSGLKVTDAIKNIYEVIDDKRLKRVLIRMAGRYELTTDIDAALDEFRSVYDTHEAESFCVAIKQGIVTGDNSELLSRQEEVMFKKYFNYVQEETDSYKTKSLIAAIVFISIIVIMVLIPMFFETTGAMGKIFAS